MEKYDFMYKNVCIGTLTSREVENIIWFDFKLTIISDSKNFMTQVLEMMKVDKI